MEIISFRFQDFLSAFIILFAVIDITGLTPIIIDMKQKGQNIIAWKAAVYSLVTFLAFLFMGNMILNLFQVDISSFAIAGALVIFVMAIEMLLGVEIFRNDGPEGAASIVPIVFPLIAGAGSFTTLLSLRALYGLGSILAALFLNILVIYVVIRNVHIWSVLWGKRGFMYCASSSVLFYWHFRFACFCRIFPLLSNHSDAY